jgi:hypothetical protein
MRASVASSPRSIPSTPYCVPVTTSPYRTTKTAAARAVARRTMMRTAQSIPKAMSPSPAPVTTGASASTALLTCTPRRRRKSRSCEWSYHLRLTGGLDATSSQYQPTWIARSAKPPPNITLEAYLAGFTKFSVHNT